MVVIHLVEGSLRAPKVRGSTPVVGKLLYPTFNCLLSNVIKRQNKEKEAGNGQCRKVGSSMVRPKMVI